MKNLSIGIDIRVLARGTRTGIEEYLLNLLPRLLTMDSRINYKLFYNGLRKVKLAYPWLELPNVELKEFKYPNRILDACSQLFRWPKMDKLLGGVDIFFSPHFLPVAVSKDCKRIITFHDLSFKQHSQFFSFSRKLWHFLTFPKSQAKQADKILADSFSTKEDLMSVYNLDPQKIEVVHLGIKDDFKPIDKSNSVIKQVVRRYNLPNNFILYFGTIEPRKNITSLIKAFELLKKKSLGSSLETVWKGFEGVVKGKGENKFEDLKLVIAGSKGWLYKQVFRAIEDSPFKKDIMFTGFIEDEDKPYLYNSANVFVYPSFFEGFGFPPLEAMACGVPTIVSNTSSLPEVVGQGAIMIDPYKIEELSYVIGKTLVDKELRGDLISKGLAQAKKFDWENTAERFLEIARKRK